MADPIVRTLGLDNEFDKPLSWDTVWQSTPDAHGNFGFGDWAVADPTEEPANAGGLRSQDPLSTAIFIQLTTRARAPSWMKVDGSPGGWHGNHYDLQKENGERELGSLIWTVLRGPVTYEVLRKVESYAATALQTLIDQGAVSAFDIRAEPDMPNGWIKLRVIAYAPNGKAIFANSFPII